MKKLIFTKGNETRPKFENLRDENVLNNSIFTDIYDRAFSLIKEISTPIVEQNDKHNRERNNIIAFIGERGSGKTSCLKSIYYSLDRHQSGSLPSLIKDINTSYNIQLPIIDPSYIDDQSNIIEIVIAHMFRTFKKDVNNKRCFDGDNIEKKRELVKKFQNVKDALDCTKPINSKSTSNDSIEELSKLAAGSNLHNSMEELVRCYLNYFRYEGDDSPQMLVIAIDDLDVQTNHTYQMVEQIRKYLIIDNVLILMGVKLVQLSDLIKNKFVEDFKNKDNNFGLNDQINDMVARYLIKLLPLSHRLNLPSYNDMPEVELVLVSSSETDNNDSTNIGDLKVGDQSQRSTQIEEIINLHETILALIYKKTGVMFYNIGQASLIVPHNLRELLNMIAMLNNMSNNEKSKNRVAFKQYFIESWCLDRLNPGQLSFIKALNDCDSSKINKFIIQNIDFKSMGISISHNSQNYSIADINHLLYNMSNHANISRQRFAFAIKTVYSMILHGKYEEIKDPDKLAFYTNLFYKYQSNGIAYQLANPLNHIFDYDKMIGSNLIYLDYQTQELNVDTNVVEHYKVNKYYEWLKSRITNSQNEEFCQEQKNRFNTLELLLLSKYNTNADSNHYNYFPIDSCPISDNITCSTSAMIYNITRYVNLYHIYNKLKEAKYNDKICSNMELVKFFDMIEHFGDYSIIKQLLQQLCKVNNLAIINIETLCLLNEYLTIQTKYSENDITKVVRKMLEYKFFVYNLKTKQQKEQDISLFKIRMAEHNLDNIANIINEHIQLIKSDNLETIFNEYE